MGSGSATINGGTLDLDGQTIATPLTVVGVGFGGNGALINSNMAIAAGDSASISEAPVRAFIIGGPGNVTLSGPVGSSNNFTVTKVGAGMLTLGGSGDNSYLGLVVDSGTVILDKNSNDSPDVHAVGGVGLTVNSGGTVQLSGTGDYQLYQGADATVNAGGVLDLDGQNQTLTTGLLTLDGSGSGSGALINSLAGSTATLTASVSLASNSSIGGPGYLALAGTISGSGSLTQTGPGMARRAGQLVFGFDNVLRALDEKVPPRVLIEAQDGAADGRRKLSGSAYARGLSVETIDCLSRAELSLALGRENVIHAAVKPGPLAERLIVDSARLLGFRARPVADGTAGSSPARNERDV